MFARGTSGSGVDFSRKLGYGTAAMYEFFYDEAVIRMIVAILVSHSIRDELEDHTQNVVVECIDHCQRKGGPPKDVAEAKAIARPIAESYAIDVVRMRASRGRSHVGPTGNADDHAGTQGSRDPVAMKRVLKIVGEVLSETELERMHDKGAGVKQSQLARESGTSAATERKRTQATRDKLYKKLAPMGLWGMAALVGFWAIYVGVFPHAGDSAGGNPASKQQLAAEHRRAAAEKCKEQLWDQCENELDDAAGLDRESEQRAEVKELRAAITAGRGANAQRDAGAGERRAPPDGRW